MGKKNNINLDENFWCDVLSNNMGYLEYYKRLTNIALTVFEWVNLPPTIDERMLELSLFYDGHAVFFKDETIGYLCMRCSVGGTLSNYNVPNDRWAISPNGYNRHLTEKDSVLIYNDYLRSPSCITSMQYSKQLFEMDKTIGINVNAQRTPLLLLCDESQRKTMETYYAKFVEGKPAIFGSKELDLLNTIKALNTQAPYLVDKLQEAKANVWNEALTYLGVPNMVEEKKERMLVDEVNRLQGGVFANQYSRLCAREQACKQINEMFKLENPISVKVRDEYKSSQNGGESVE